MPPFTTALQQPVAGVEGGLGAMSPNEVITAIATAGVRAGLVVQRTVGAAAEDTCTPLAVLPAVDADAILVGPILPVVAGQRLNDVQGAPGGVLDGLIGENRIFPPRALTFTADANVNWGLPALGGTFCYFLGDDSNQMPMAPEWFFLPAGGGVVITSEFAYSRCHAVYVGACAGAGGGAATVGVSNATVALGKADFAFAVYDAAIEPSATAVLTYDTDQDVPLLKDGTIWATNELTNNIAILPGDPIAVRVLLAGLDVRGQITKHVSLAATPNFAHLVGARALTPAAAGELVLIRIGG